MTIGVDSIFTGAGDDSSKVMKVVKILVVVIVVLLVLMLVYYLLRKYVVTSLPELWPSGSETPKV